MATKEPTTKPAKKTAKAEKTVSEKKPRASRKVAAKPAVKEVTVAAVESTEAAVVEPAVLVQKPKIAGNKYIFATGRRKTAVANVRVFGGAGDNILNKKKFDVYFSQSSLRDTALRPLALTGLMGDFHFTAHVSGGGIFAQSEAVRHGIAQALASLNNDVKLVLKKNGFLTRDDRKKERKKPGLRGARRAPQWAKR